MELGSSSRMSRCKERQLAQLSVRLPYEEAKKVYEEISGLKVSRMTLHRSVQRLGVALRALPMSEATESAKQPLKRQVTADGTMINLRREGWKEAKVGACYNVDEHRRAKAITYVATLEERARVGPMLYRASGEPSMDRTQDMAFIGDGASWLDEIQQEHFPLATRIVDIWHASEYLWAVSNEFYGPGSQKAHAWAESKVQQLKDADQVGLSRSLSHLAPKTPQQTEVLKNTRRYFRNHGHHMDYPAYLKRGWHIGSGIAEGGCKYVIEARFKQAGMRWSREGASHLLGLRLAYLNDTWSQVAQCQQN